MRSLVDQSAHIGGCLQTLRIASQIGLQFVELPCVHCLKHTGVMTPVSKVLQGFGGGIESVGCRLFETNECPKKTYERKRRPACVMKPLLQPTKLPALAIQRAIATILFFFARIVVGIACFR